MMLLGRAWVRSKSGSPGELDPDRHSGTHDADSARREQAPRCCQRQLGSLLNREAPWTKPASMTHRMPMKAESVPRMAHADTRRAPPAGDHCQSIEGLFDAWGLAQRRITLWVPSHQGRR